MQAIAPSGVLRVALNHGNPVLVGRDDMGAPIGITPDLARGFAQSRGLALRFINFDRAVDVSACADQDAWDLAFLAVDPTRAETIAFSDPYLRIEGVIWPARPARRMMPGRWRCWAFRLAACAAAPIR